MEYLWQKFDLIFTSIMTLMGVFVGFILERLTKRLDHRKKMKDELNILKMGFGAAVTTIKVTELLIELKKYFISYPRFSRRKDNMNFFDKWYFTNPFFDDIALHENMQYPFTKEQLLELHKEIAKLKV